MKKTTTISLAKTLFHIEEDAYVLLDTYLSTVRAHFASHADKEEILSDIESRIAERFSESNESIVSLNAVQSVIDAMGTIGQFDATEPGETPTGKTNKRLYRDADMRVIAGVAAGLGHYFGIDRTVIRVLFIVSIFFGGFGVFVYIILWIATPAALTSAQKLEMRGEAVTLKAMSEVVRERFGEIDHERIKNGAKDISQAIERGAKGFFDAVGPVLRALLGVFVTVGSLIATAGLTVLATLGLFRLPERLFGPSVTTLLRGGEYTIAVIACYLSIVLPVIIVLLWGISLLRKKSMLNRINVLVVASLWFIALIVAGVTVSQLSYRVSEYMRTDPSVVAQTVNKPLEPFVALTVHDAKRVTIVEGSAYAIQYNGTQASIDRTTATIVDGVLTIEGDDTIPACLFCHSQSLSITITTPELVALTATDAAVIQGDITTTGLEVTTKDASRIMVNGTATTLTLSTTDASRFDGTGLAVKSARVLSRNASMALVDADTILVVDAHDASYVRYSGTPQISIKKTDAATVESLEVENE